MILVKKSESFLYFNFVKIRPEKILNDMLDKKDTFLGYKNVHFLKFQKRMFLKGKPAILVKKNSNCFFI